MSERERKLLLLFGAAGVILLSLWGYKSYENKRVQIGIDRKAAETALLEGQMFLASRDSIMDEIEWLAEHEPEPQASELVPTKLQSLASSEATNSGMTVKKMDILPDRMIESAEVRRYKVAQVKFTVTGEERNLYAWLDRMHSPNDFRVISEITLSPNRDDDSKIDCIVTFDQWFVPVTSNL
jgi:outer membrane protease